MTVLLLSLAAIAAAAVGLTVFGLLSLDAVRDWRAAQRVRAAVALNSTPESRAGA